MKVHVRTPFDLYKNLGKAYNEEMSTIPEGDWACFIDHDVSFLTSDAINILHNYADRYSHTGLFTCYGSRMHPSQPDQLIDKIPSTNFDFKHHIGLAEMQKAFLYQVTPINHEISGMLMMVSRETWYEHKFWESGKCLGIDNDYSLRLLAAGKTIYRMDGLYVWHTYRPFNITDKSHLL